MPCADKRIRKIYYSMANTTFYLTQATQVMINKLQSLKRKTKIKFYQTLNVFYDEMNIRRQSGKFKFQEDPFSKNVEGIGKFYHEVLLLTNFLQTKPSVKNVNYIYSDLYYTVIKNRDDKEILIDENIEYDYINFKDFITLNLYIGRKQDNMILS